ncbi:MAG: MFS transporter [Chloroflexi bacterium]|nr:MFS transporter [Chloroflexota bacterium]
MARSSRPPSTRFPYAAVLLISFGHFIHDIFPAFYGVLLPKLAPALGLTRATAGLLTFARQAPAALNPFLGYWADRISLRWFVILAPGLTATGMTLLGWMPDVPSLAVLLLVVGVSVALFHAPAPALVARVSHPYTGRGMSLFMAAGELGRAVGPVIAVATVHWLGMRRLPALALLGWLASAVLAWRLATVEATLARRTGLSWRHVRAWTRRFVVPLTVLILGRAAIVGALGTYLAWYLTERGLPLTRAGFWVAGYELAGVAGALTLGTVSDFLGRRRTVALSTVLAAGFLLAFVMTPVPWNVWWLLPLGFTALAIQPVMLALVQDLAPDHRATANGIYLAMSFLLRPVGVSAVGAIADRFHWDMAFVAAAGWAVLTLAVLPWLRPAAVGREG